MAKVAKTEEKSGRKAAVRKEAKGKKGGNVLNVRQDRTHCSLVQERKKQEPVRHERRWQ